MIVRDWKCESMNATYTYREKSFFKHQQWSWEANDKDRLGSNEAEDDTLDAGGDHELWHTHIFVSFVS